MTVFTPIPQLLYFLIFGQIFHQILNSQKFRGIAPNSSLYIPAAMRLLQFISELCVDTKFIVSWKNAYFTAVIQGGKTICFLH